MKEYKGYQIRCGCKDHEGHSLMLEGYSDATGSHFCATCDNYVKPATAKCRYQTEELIKRREAIIVATGALND